MPEGRAVCIAEGSGIGGRGTDTDSSEVVKGIVDLWLIAIRSIPGNVLVGGYRTMSGELWTDLSVLGGPASAVADNYD